MSFYIPASLILSPADAALYIAYQNWDDDFDEADLGIIQEALDYHYFLEWRLTNLPKPGETPQQADIPSNKSGKSSQSFQSTQIEYPVSDQCGHSLHPNDRHTENYCPVCEMNICVQFQNAIADAWDEVGGPFNLPGDVKDQTSTSGPWHNTGTVDVSQKWSGLRTAWRDARCALANLVFNHEEVAKSEARWNKRHPGEMGFVDMANTATKSVEIARAQIRYAVVGTHDPPPVEKKQKVKKSVSFTDDTIFLPNDRNRNQEFSRHRSHYVPGDNACPNAEGWANTSFYRDNFFNLEQYKVMTVVEVAGLAMVHHGQLIGMDSKDIEGVAAIHDEWDQIKAHLDKVVENPDMDYIIDGTDTIVVVQNMDGEVVDTIFVQTEEHKKGEFVPRCDAWTWVAFDG